jgi:hypothetical protein
VPAKSVARPSLENASQLIPPSKSNEELGKRCALPSSQMGQREISEFSLGWDKSTKNTLRSCALTLDECALAAEHCITAAEE